MRGTEGTVRTMLTIEEKIRQLEAIAESGDELYADYKEHGLQDTNGARRAKSLIEEKRQEIAWLRELQERRKEPEIVRCRECKFSCKYEDSDIANYAGYADEVYCSEHDIYKHVDWYCADAERRTDGKTTGD